MLASSVQRSKSAPYPSKARSAFVRRAVVVALVLVALTLLTISFRSPTEGALHDVQGVGASALRPFQVAATRVARPFRDAYSYVDNLTKAKGENAALKREVKVLKLEAIQGAAAQSRYESLAKLMHFEQGQSYPNGYRAVNAAVISFPSGPFAHQLMIAAGSSSGLRVNTPVISGYGLIGRVSNVFPDTAIVTLLTDPESAVEARDVLQDVRGILKPGPRGTLILDQVPKQLKVDSGDVIVTDGTHNAQYPSLFPYGIPIGRITDVTVTDTSTFLQVQVQPFADIGSLDSVAALVAKKRNG